MTILLATGSSFKTTAWPCVFLYDRGSGVSRKINVCSAVPFRFANGKLLGDEVSCNLWYSNSWGFEPDLLFIFISHIIFHFPALRDLLTHHLFLQITILQLWTLICTLDHTRTQSLLKCFLGGERRLGIRLRSARGLMGREEGKIATGRRSALYSTHQNHIDQEGLRLNFE